MNNLLSIEDFLIENRMPFTSDQINESLEYLNSVDPALLEAWYNTLLDFAALIPGVGSIAEGINLVSYAKQGEYLLAALCAVGIIPIFGQYIGAGGTLLVKALRSGSTLGGKILKPLINLIAKFFPKIVAFFKSSSFLSKFSGISPFVGRMLKSLKNFVMSGGKSIAELSKNPAKIKELTQVARELKRGVRVGKAFFGGGGGNKIPVPEEAFAGYQGSGLKNVRPYSDQEIYQAGGEDWARYLA